MHSSRAAQIVLAPKPLSEFSPEEFKAYVISLHGTRTKASKPKSNGLSAYRRKNGKLVVICRRDWKWILESEMEQLSTMHAAPLNELFIYLKEQGFTILKDEKEAQEIQEQVQEIREHLKETPW